MNNLFNPLDTITAEKFGEWLESKNISSMCSQCGGANSNINSYFHSEKNLMGETVGETIENVRAVRLPLSMDMDGLQSLGVDSYYSLSCSNCGYTRFFDKSIVEGAE